MNSNQKETWSKEFSEFSNEALSEVKAPQEIFSKIKTRLFPNPWTVFGKLAGLHVVVGFLSLSICNQFGLNPFQTNYSLSEWFMKIAGHHFCMFACGVFFVATTYVLANIFLRIEELEAVRRHEWLQTGVLSLLSIAGFYFLGAELVVTFVGLWILGAFIGGFLSVGASIHFRRLFN